MSGPDSHKSEVAQSTPAVEALGAEETIRHELTRLREVADAAQSRESVMRRKLAEAHSRIRSLEEDPESIAPALQAPVWVVGSLRRALARARAAFETMPDIADALDRYEESMLAGERVISEADALEGLSGALHAKMELLTAAIEVLRDLAASALPTAEMRRLTLLAEDAEDAISVALAKTERSPLVLGSHVRQPDQ